MLRNCLNVCLQLIYFCKVTQVASCGFSPTFFTNLHSKSSSQPEFECWWPSIESSIYIEYRSFDLSYISEVFCPPSPVIPVFFLNLFMRILNGSCNASNIEIVSFVLLLIGIVSNAIIIFIYIDIRHHFPYPSCVTEVSFRGTRFAMLLLPFLSPCVLPHAPVLSDWLMNQCRAVPFR